MKPAQVSCIVVKSDNLDDWWLIERAEHDGRMWMEPCEGGASLMCSSRLGSADIEGTGAEMLALAEAIEGRGSAEFRRCAARWTDDGVEVCSPRNSSGPFLISHDAAVALAADIRAKVLR